MGYQKHNMKIPFAADKRLTILYVYSQRPWSIREPEPLHSMSNCSEVYQYLVNVQGYLDTVE